MGDGDVALRCWMESKTSGFVTSPAKKVWTSSQPGARPGGAYSDGCPDELEVLPKQPDELGVSYQ